MASTRKQEISEETRRRLVKAAAELAAEGGSAAMSVQAVAERSGISRGSVAWHFGSKDGLLRAVVEDAFRWGMEKLRAELASSSATGIEALIEANFVLMSYPEARIFSTILIEAVIPGSTIRETYAEQYVAIRTLYADFLRSIDTPVANPELVAVTLLAGTLGINLQHRLDPDNVDRRSAVTELESIYARAMASTATSGHENPAAHENP